MAGIRVPMVKKQQQKTVFAMTKHSYQLETLKPREKTERNVH